MLPALPTVSKWVSLPVKLPKNKPLFGLPAVASGRGNALIEPQLYFNRFFSQYPRPLQLTVSCEKLSNDQFEEQIRTNGFGPSLGKSSEVTAVLGKRCSEVSSTPPDCQ